MASIAARLIFVVAALSAYIFIGLTSLSYIFAHSIIQYGDAVVKTKILSFIIIIIYFICSKKSAPRGGFSIFLCYHSTSGPQACFIFFNELIKFDVKRLPERYIFLTESTAEIIALVSFEQL